MGSTDWYNCGFVPCSDAVSLWHCSTSSTARGCPCPWKSAPRCERMHRRSLLRMRFQQKHADAYPWRFKSPGAQTFTEKDAEDLLTNLGYFAFLAFDGSAPIGYLVSELVRRPETARQFAHELIYIHEVS